MFNWVVLIYYRLMILVRDFVHWHSFSRNKLWYFLLNFMILCELYLNLAFKYASGIRSYPLDVWEVNNFMSRVIDLNTSNSISNLWNYRDNSSLVLLKKINKENRVLADQIIHGCLVQKPYAVASLLLNNWTKSNQEPKRNFILEGL